MAELVAAKFGIQIKDVGAALGSPGAIRAALLAAGFQRVQARATLGGWA